MRDKHEWTDERPCWVGGAITLRIDEEDALLGMLSFRPAEGGPFQPAERLPLVRNLLCREILRLRRRVEELERWPLPLAIVDLAACHGVPGGYKTEYARLHKLCDANGLALSWLGHSSLCAITRRA